VFLVEDEAIIRLMIADMLLQLGHSVVAEAGTIEDAQSLAQIADADLALLDVNLVGHNIAPVTEVLLARGIPFIFITGYDPEGLQESSGKALVLQKPFSISKLKDAIETALGDPL
jgi:CheY-like chemotaxis protein